MFVLKLQLLKLKHSQIWLPKQPGGKKMAIETAAFQMSGMANRYTKYSTKHYLGRPTYLANSPTCHPSCTDQPRNVWVEHSPI